MWVSYEGVAKDSVRVERNDVSLSEYLPVMRAFVVPSNNSPSNVYPEDEGTFIPRIIRNYSPTDITSLSEILENFL
jgi:hypothetical protein